MHWPKRYKKGRETKTNNNQRETEKSKDDQQEPSHGCEHKCLDISEQALLLMISLLF
jgi:hypothetical protein